MEPAPRQSFHPAGAGMILLGTLLTAIAIGALIGWAMDAPELGALGGAIVGIPAGVFAVYRRYRGYFA